MRSPPENHFLRKQLPLYIERKRKPRRATDAIRFTMAQLSRFFEWRDALTVVSLRQHSTRSNRCRELGRHIARFGAKTRRAWRWTSTDVQGLLGQCAMATVAILGTLATWNL